MLRRHCKSYYYTWNTAGNLIYCTLIQILWFFYDVLMSNEGDAGEKWNWKSIQWIFEIMFSIVRQTKMRRRILFRSTLGRLKCNIEYEPSDCISLIFCRTYCVQWKNYVTKSTLICLLTIKSGYLIIMLSLRAANFDIKAKDLCICIYSFGFGFWLGLLNVTLPYNELKAKL